MDPEIKWYSFRWRTLALVFVIIILFVGYVGWRLYNAVRIRPMGSGPAGPPVAAEPFEQVWSQTETVFLGVGDSITRGYGASRPYTYFNLLLQNEDEMYPDMKGKDLFCVFPNLTAHNYAVDYTVSREHIDQQLVRIPHYGPNVRGIIVVTSGGNDLIHDYGRTPPQDGAMYGCTYKQAIPWCENLKLRLKTLLTGIMDRFPGGCEIFLANIFDPTDGVSDPQTVGMARWPDGSKVLALANQKIAELCEEYPNVHLVDIHSEFLGHGIHCDQPWRKHYRREDPHFWYAPILEDPNIRGHDAIRRLFLIEMIRVLAPREALSI
jgi:lysophospholipase L1-like esterase